MTEIIQDLAPDLKTKAGWRPPTSLLGVYQTLRSNQANRSFGGTFKIFLVVQTEGMKCQGVQEIGAFMHHWCGYCEQKAEPKNWNTLFNPSLAYNITGFYLKKPNFYQKKKEISLKWTLWALLKNSSYFLWHFFLQCYHVYRKQTRSTQTALCPFITFSCHPLPGAKQK